jgi:formylglycine-generating enzyme required for sulfatase activity/serine/threonine protein kinase
LGLDFREILTERVAGCDVLLAVIGDDWLSIAGKSGTRRLDDPGDFVRIEIQRALDRDIPVIPVLVGNSSVPQAVELPDSLRKLAFRNGLAVRPDPDFHNDVDRLIRGINDVVSTMRGRTAPRGPGTEGSEGLNSAKTKPSIDPHAGSSSAVKKPRDASQSLPDLFGRYRIIKRLGQGGIGSVYVAEDTHLKRQVALKVPDFGPESSPEPRRRFLQAARAAATLDHPYLCPIYDSGEINGWLYLVMAYIDGKSLAELTLGKRLPPRPVAALVGKLALAMQEAHKKKVFHCDLTPANVIMTATRERREPVIVGFGQVLRDNPKEARFIPGEPMGTLGYMAPEQIRGDPEGIGPACDIYALGVVLYELLTGRLPFSRSGLDVASQILTVTPLPPSTLQCDIDAALEAICLNAMARQARDRYASMDELTAALTGFLRSRPAAAMPTSPASPPGSPAPTSAKPCESTGSNSRVGQLANQLGEKKASPRPIPTPEVTASPQLSPERRRPSWPLIVAAAVLGVLLLGVIVYVVTDKGQITMVVNDPKAVVKIDGEEVRVEALGAPITLRAGEHALEVKWGDGEFQTRTFVVHRGDDERLRIEYEPARKSTTSANGKKAPSPAPKTGTERDSTVPPKLIARAIDSAVSPKQISNSIGMRLALIPAGEFLMGSPDSDKDARDDEKPQHRVQITRPFYLGVHEVTQGQYRAVTGANPSAFRGSDDPPVEAIKVFHALEFCNALSLKERIEPYYRSEGIGDKRKLTLLNPNGDGYRLPTEAEWEYACRAGGTTRYGFGDDVARLGEFAWYNGNSGSRTHLVGQKQPNAWGLLDMHGNVWEWCGDRWVADFYRHSPMADPVSTRGFIIMVYRGGSWDYDSQNARSAGRCAANMTMERYETGMGFRVARAQSGR